MMSDSNKIYRYSLTKGVWRLDSFTQLLHIHGEIYKKGLGYVNRRAHKSKKISTVYLKDKIPLKEFKMNLLVGMYDE